MLVQQGRRSTFLKTRLSSFVECSAQINRGTLADWFVGRFQFLALSPPLALSASSCVYHLGLAALDAPSGLDILRAGVGVEAAFARLIFIECVYAFSTENLVLVSGWFRSKDVTAVGALERREMDERTKKRTVDDGIGKYALKSCHRKSRTNHMTAIHSSVRSMAS